MGIGGVVFAIALVLRRFSTIAAYFRDGDVGHHRLKARGREMPMGQTMLRKLLLKLLVCLLLLLLLLRLLVYVLLLLRLRLKLLLLLRLRLKLLRLLLLRLLLLLHKLVMRDRIARRRSLGRRLILRQRRL